MRRQLRSARLAQEKYEQNRKELIAGISHDLSTPLTLLKGYASGILVGIAKTAEKRHHYVELIYQNACTLEKLVDRLFLFSKLDLGQVSFMMERVSLRDYFADFAAENTERLAGAVAEFPFIAVDALIGLCHERLFGERAMVHRLELDIQRALVRLGWCLGGLLATAGTAAAAPAGAPGTLGLPFDERIYSLAYDAFLGNRNLADAFRVADSAVRQRPDDLAWRERLAKVAEWHGQPRVALDQWLLLARRDAPALAAAWVHLHTQLPSREDTRAHAETFSWPAATAQLFAALQPIPPALRPAAAFGAVSLMRRNPDGTWHGDMLDGLAFVQAQRERGATIKGRRALLLGAGGAGSGKRIHRRKLQYFGKHGAG